MVGRTLNGMKALLVTVSAALVLMSGSAAHAGPTPEQPAIRNVTPQNARHIAHYVIKTLVGSTPTPHHYTIGPCPTKGSPKVRVCGLRWSAPDSSCSARLWIWADEGSFYYEWHQFRCA